ncbi:MAG: type II toxin-antitoxin system Phd/YefM family antitoxin [Chloroflexi bacterium]|nr:type II toxin-antitoxin system Phd/YefM family antitoxin [Chloroflexota bacterium]
MMDEPMMTQTIPISQARQKLGALVNQVYKRQVRIVVEKSGIPVVALVSPCGS